MRYEDKKLKKYRIVQYFDGENIDRFDAKLAIHQNFSFQLYSK